MEIWNFSEENKNLLNKLIKVSHETSQSVVNNKLNELFTHILKTNEDDEISKMEVISVPSDSEECPENKLKSQLEISFEELIENEELEIELKYFIETLENENSTLTESDLLPILNLNQIDKTLIYLGEKLSIQGVFKLSSVILTIELGNKENIIKLFCLHILLPKFIETEISSIFETVIIEISKLHQNIVCESLLINLIIVEHPNHRILNKICEQIDLDSQHYLLRLLILKCPQDIEERHIELLQTLYQNDTENYLKRRLIELLNDSVDRFTSSKIYGKFLVTLLKSLDRQFEDCANILNYIIEQNTSIYKRAAKKLCDNLFTTDY